MHRIGLLLLGGWIGASSGLATGLDDLRGALEKLRAKEPLSARFVHETRKNSKEEGENRTRQGRATVIVEDGGPGAAFHLIFEDALLTEASKDHPNPEVSNPAEALSGISPLAVLKGIRTADELLDELKGAQVVNERMETRGGRSLRLVELKISPPESAKREKRLKNLTATSRFWIDETGVPVASESSIHAEARILLLKFKIDTKEESTYSVVAGRLIRSRRNSENKQQASLAGGSTETATTTVEPILASPSRPATGGALRTDSATPIATSIAAKP